MSLPINMVVLETPAGFQPNSALVAQRVADYVGHHLRNYQPQVTVVPARARGSAFSPDDPDIITPLLQANVIFVGAGSPTYAARQLRDSLAWSTLLARHRLGAAVILASAGAIAASRHALPVYEIYKVGDELHWVAGLDLFGPYGLALAIVSHWDNRDGGADLDTSRGFVGGERFRRLCSLLPANTTVIGLDEHTGLIVDLGAEKCLVEGRGGICLCQGEEERVFSGGSSFAISEMGPFRAPDPTAGIPLQVWRDVRQASASPPTVAPVSYPPRIISLVQRREVARSRRDWSAADSLREELARQGYRIEDTADGPVLHAVDPH
jgi:hypothetical protein